jgi:hypothetical protein
VTNYNLFPDTPTVPVYDGGLSVNVGTAFYTTGPAWVTQIRYLHGDAGPESRWDARTGALWTIAPDGQTLGLVAGPFELPAPIAVNQWVTFELPAPFQLAPGQMYRVAVLHPSGGYPASGGYFDGYADRIYGPVTVPAAGNVPGNMQGTYKYTPFAADVPDATFRSTAYFADVTVTDVDPATPPPPPPPADELTGPAAGTLAPQQWAGTLPDVARTGTLAPQRWAGTL